MLARTEKRGEGNSFLVRVRQKGNSPISLIEGWAIRPRLHSNQVFKGEGNVTFARAPAQFNKGSDSMFLDRRSYERKEKVPRL